MIQGKILGFFVGWILAGPVGVFFGLWLGHRYDEGWRPDWLQLFIPYSSADKKNAQQAFFNAMFSVMGHIAKADGRVTEQNIQLAEKIMDRFCLTLDQRREAIRLFKLGKEPDFNLDAVLVHLRRDCHQHRPLLQIFMEIQMQAVMVDGFSENKKRLLDRICFHLGCRPVFGFHDASGRQRRERTDRQTPTPTEMSNPYEVLGISPNASALEIKKAYRKLISQNHPDKLMAQGLPQSMVRLATEKTQKIQAAYEALTQSRS